MSLRILTATSLVLALGLVACGDDDDPGTDGGRTDSGTTDSGVDAGGIDAGDPTMAAIRVIHLSPDAPAVDVYIDNGATPTIENLAFGQTTAYLSVDPGTYEFDVTATGTAIGSAVIADLSQTVEAGMSYTIAAIGELATIQALALVDDNTPVAGSAKVRIIHAATAVGEVDIWNITNPGAATPIAMDVPFGAAGEMPIELPAGTYSVGIDADNDPSTIEAGFPVVPAADGLVGNIYASNDETGAIALRVQVDVAMTSDTTAIPATPLTYVRVAHLAPSVGGVDVFANEGAMASVTNLEFENGTQFLVLPEATYSFQVSPTGMTAADAVLELPDTALAADTFYTAVAYEDAGTPTLLVVAPETVLPPPASGVQVRAVHTASNVGEVDIYNTADTSAALVEDLARGDFSEELNVPMGAYTLGIDTDNALPSELEYTTPALADGTQVNLFAVERADASVVLFALFADGTSATIPAN